MFSTESSPRFYASEIKFNDNDSRGRVLNALKNSDDSMKGFASQNVSSSLDDSPRASDRLSRRTLVEACADVLESFESPYISVTCRTFRE